MQTANPKPTTMGQVTDERRGVYPFCAPCTAASEAWRAAELTGPMGGRFYGHRDVCESCGSSVRTLYNTVLWVPVSKAGRYRIIPTGGRSYVARKVVDAPVAAVVRREPVPLVHPELDASPEFRLAEACWAESEPGHALPHYQAALAERENVLAADDPATLRVRLRVAQGLLATSNYGRAIAWFELITPQLVAVFGPHHELTRAATEAVTGARLMVGGPRSEARLLTDIVAADVHRLTATDPQLLRDRAALGKALLAAGDISDAVEALIQVVRDAAPGHPDTAVYRAALTEACEVAEARGKKRDVQLAGAARQLLDRADVPTSR